MSTCTDCDFHLYADDTVLYCIADSAELAVTKLQLAFNSLQNALVELRLVLNAGKTKFILFSRSTISDSDIPTIKSVTGSTIERVFEYKYLGIWLDAKLSFNFHISDLVSKLRQKLGFLYSKKSYFPISCRKEIIEATFLSVMDYGDTIYRSAASSLLKRLDTVYHSALRWITGDPYGTHRCVLYEGSGLPSLTERRDKHWYLFLFKAISGMLPAYICSMLEPCNTTYLTRSSDLIMLKVPRALTELGKTAFSVNGPASWNLLQKSLKLTALPSIGQFKGLLHNTFPHECTCFS